MEDCGIVSKTVLTYSNPEVKQDYRIEMYESKRPKPFKFEHVFAAIVVLMAGSCLAALVFGAEIGARKGTTKPSPNSQMLLIEM